MLLGMIKDNFVSKRINNVLSAYLLLTCLQWIEHQSSRKISKGSRINYAQWSKVYARREEVGGL